MRFSSLAFLAKHNNTARCEHNTLTTILQRLAMPFYILAFLAKPNDTARWGQRQTAVSSQKMAAKNPLVY